MHCASRLLENHHVLVRGHSLAVVALVVFASVPTARAGINVWTSHGPTGVAIDALVIDPAAPSTLYAAGSGNAGRINGVYKSTDGGESWNLTSLNNVTVFALAILPAAPGTLYAWTGRGLFRSTDGGWIWASTVLQPPAEINALAIDPAAPGTLYAATYSGVYELNDEDQSWTPTLFCGVIGVDFPRVPCGGFFNAITTLAISPRTPSTLYASTASGVVFKSTDTGANWGVLPTTIPGPNLVNTLVVDPTTPSTLYVGMYIGGGLFKSTDAGASWNVTSLTSVSILAIAIDPTARDTLYAGTAGGIGVAKSTDGGASWSALNAGLPLPFLSINTLAISPGTASTLYAGTSGGGVFSIQQVAVPATSTPTATLPPLMATPTPTLTKTATAVIPTATPVSTTQCVGDCEARGSVEVTDLITLVNIALGNAQPSACPHGIPTGASVDMSLIVRAVNSALSGCP